MDEDTELILNRALETLKLFKENRPPVNPEEYLALVRKQEAEIAAAEYAKKNKKSIERKKKMKNFLCHCGSKICHEEYKPLPPWTVDTPFTPCLMPGECMPTPIFSCAMYYEEPVEREVIGYICNDCSAKFANPEGANSKKNKSTFNND